jgi:multidrug efflux pump subunit AcrA (membrane-fusion protein)
VLVPPQALAQRDGAAVVFVVGESGRVQQRTVKPAPQDVGTMKLIPEGLKAGETVVVSPPAALHDGSDVTTEKR